MNRLLAAVLALPLVPNFASPAADEAMKDEIAKFAGTWEVVSSTQNGRETVDPRREKLRVTFGKDGAYAFGDKASEGRIESVDPTKDPKEVTYVAELGGKRVQQKGIYKFDKDTFTDCFSEWGAKDRPTEFKSTEENGWTVAVYKRVKKID